MESLAAERTLPQRCASIVGKLLALARRSAIRIVLLVMGFMIVILTIRQTSDVAIHNIGEYRSKYFDKPSVDTTPADTTPVDPTLQAKVEAYSAPLQPPFKEQFWEVGVRLRQVHQWLSETDQQPQHRHDLDAAVESVIGSLLPFLRPYSQDAPLTALRKSYKPGSRGIVIPAGGSENSIRFAGHLITSLRVVLGCQLPIQIAYAGDADLGEKDRQRILGLEGATDVSFLDVLSLFDDSTLKLAEGGWAVKAFAALGSDLEQVILLDADAVFLQKPEVLFDQAAYTQHGAYLFHDRLLWQHAFKDRHTWFHDQIKEPSPALNKSLVWTDEYAEECDSGVVVLDKARSDVLMGLLHIAWQNTHPVREEVTYKITYGDKESWWMGLELGGASYEFEAHYGSILGWSAGSVGKEGDGRVCSFVIAHVDAADALLWYNGGLLKNKLVHPDEYDVPQLWMMDGTWEKGGSKKDMSCMVDSEVRQLSEAQKLVLQRSIEAAKAADKHLASTKTPRAAGQPGT